jgi:hypothetical protein
MRAKGLDFLGSRPWIAAASEGHSPEATSTSQELPSLLLPITNREPLIVGIAADGHRRGRGLPFPAEAQIPVLGNTENQAGRVLMAAVMERVACAETEWGQLNDTKLSWRPDGSSVVHIEAARAIATALEKETENGDSVGLVVPDSLGIAGQQAILVSIRNRDVILVPHSVAVSIAWCRDHGTGYASSGLSGEFAGYLTVCDLSLGHWSITKLPVFRDREKLSPCLVPAHFPDAKKTGFKTTGLGVLTGQTRSEYHDFLKQGAAIPWLTGKEGLSLNDQSTSDQRRASFPSLKDLEGNGLVAGLHELRTENAELTPPKDWGSCLGVITTGALAGAKADGYPLPYWIGKILGFPVQKSSDTAASLGAAYAALGLGTDLPTWLEMVDQLDLYYIGKNALGDLEPAWKEILRPQLVKAGTEIKNQQPITGLKLQPGQNSVQITIRRPGDGERMAFRKIESAPGKTNESDIPLHIDVIARPGQGFAVVKVKSREPGAFDSHLNWQRMSPCTEPKPPTLGYVPAAVEIIPDVLLWIRAEGHLWDFLNTLRGNPSNFEIVSALRTINPKIGPPLPTKTGIQTPRGTSIHSIFKVIRAIGRTGEPPIGHGSQLIEDLKSSALEWFQKQTVYYDANAWMKKFLGYLHLGCPRPAVYPVIERLSKNPRRCTAEDLHLAGLCLENSNDLNIFYTAFLNALPTSSSPSLWLIAFRNIIKFNEHALRDVSPAIANQLFVTTLNKLDWSVDNSKAGIALNCIEASIFCLKRRRYDESFALMDSPNYIQAAAIVDKWHMCPKFQTKIKLQELKKTFSNFLRTEGSLQEIATLLADDQTVTNPNVTELNSNAQ